MKSSQPPECEKKDKIPTIRMRKNSATNSKNINQGSVVILQTEDKKLTFNLRNEKEFLDRNNINSNITKMRNSIKNSLEVRSKLEQSIDNLKEEKLEKDIDGIVVQGEKKEEMELVPINSKEVNIDYEMIPGAIINQEINSGNEQILFKDDKKETKNQVDITSTNELTVRIPFTTGYESRVTHSKLTDDDNLKPVKTQIVESSNLNNSEKKSKFAKNPSQRTKILVMQKGSNKIHFVAADENSHENEENLSSQESEFPFKICFICDQFFLKDKTFNAEDCEHTFCKRCGKGYFEEKIEEGEKDFTCPVYKCNKIVSLEMLKTLVSDKHFSVIHETGIPIGENILRNKQSINNFMKINKMDSVKFYTQKHVLDLNSNEPFFIFNKAKELFCIKCSEPALYGKTGKYVVKCLNCYHSICKFCMKSYTADHYEISSFNYCKVYFRKRLRKASSKDKNCCKNFGFNLLTFIASYLMIVLAVYKIISVSLRKVMGINKQDTDFFKSFFYILIIVIIYILVTPLMLLLIPYFPALMTLFM